MIRKFNLSISINGYSTISMNDFILILGGYISSGFSADVAKYEKEAWSKIGSLLQPRSGHGSILVMR